AAQRNDLRGDVEGPNALDACFGHVLPGLAEQAIRVDASGGVLDNVGGKASPLRVESRACHAKVAGKPDEIHLLESALAQIARQSGWRLVVDIEECRVAIDVLVVSVA